MQFIDKIKHIINGAFIPINISFINNQSILKTII